MMQRRATWGLCAAVLLMGSTVGCRAGSMLESRPVNAPQTVPVGGISYHLPKKLVTVEVWAYAIQRKIDEVDEDGQPVLDPSTNLPRFRIEQSVSYFADLTAEKIVPDLRHQFVIVPQWSETSNDHLTVELTEDGLLANVNAVGDDQSAEIIKKLGALASLMVRVPTALNAIPDASRDLAEIQASRLEAVYEFDPIDPADLMRVQAELAARGITLSVTRQSDCPIAGSGPGCAESCNCTNPGIYYRLPLPYRISLGPARVVRSNTAVAMQASVDKTVLLPNEALCIYVPVERASFVRASTSLTFKQGMLTRVDTDKPSELLAFIEAPIDVAQSILAIPADLLTMRVNIIKAETGLLHAKGSQVDAQIQQLEKAQELMQLLQQLKQQNAAFEAQDDG